MKRGLLLAILGIAASAASSYGDGEIWFGNYISSEVHAPAVWCVGMAGHAPGTPVTAADGVYAELYYGIGSGLTFSQLTPLPASITQVGVLLPGAIVGNYVTIPGYTAGPVTFGIATGSSSYLWVMGATWTEPSIAVSPSPAGTFTASLLDAAYPNGLCVLCLECEPPPPPPQFYYTTTNGTITITGYSGPGGVVTIPSAINGLPVTSIAAGAYFGSYSNVITIGIPGSVTNIGAGAFDGIVVAIGVDPSNQAYSSVEGVLFDKNQTELIRYPKGGRNGTYAIPDSVTNIWDFAFNQCTGLTSVMLPDSITSIGRYAFSSCTSLLSVAIPDSVISIGTSAFLYCSSMTNAMIGNSLASIPDSAFWSCSGLASVTIPGSVISIGENAFRFCADLTGVTIPNSVIRIGAHAFDYCTSLTNISIPDSVTSIGAGAFGSCTSLKAITVGALNTAYSSTDGVLFSKTQSLLVQCPAGKSGAFTIPNGVTSIGDSAFQTCRSLTSVTMPSGVTCIGDSAFSECYELTDVPIPHGVINIGALAFKYCMRLAEVTIPNSVTSILWETFADCSSLTNVVIGNSVSNIGDRAFKDCGLTGVTIPNSVTNIGSEAFAYCSSLTSAVIGSGVTSIGDFVFDYCNRLIRVTIGKSVTRIEYNAFGYCTSLTSIYFEGNAPSLNYAFNGDTNATVYYLAGTTGWGSTFGGFPTALWVLPSATPVNAATLQDQPLILTVVKLLSLAHGPQGDPLVVSSVSTTSTNGGSVVLGQDQISYAPVSGYLGADRFSYTVSDTTTGGSVSASVFVQVLATNQISANMLPLSAMPGGYQVSFAGIPGRTYSVQRAPTVIGPWVTIAAVSVDTSGIGVIQDTNSLEGTAFYRTTYP